MTERDSGEAGEAGGAIEPEVVATPDRQVTVGGDGRLVPFRERYEEVPLGRLYVHSVPEMRFQREVRRRKVDRIKANFDPILLDPLVVWEDTEGNFEIVDGQHRVAALRELGFRAATARVISGCPRSEVVRYYTGQHTSERETRLTVWDRHPGLLLQNDRLARWAEEVPKEFGYSIGKETGSGRIVALQTVYNILGAVGARGSGDERLRRVLSVVAAAHGQDERALTGFFLGSVAARLFRRSTRREVDLEIELDDERLSRHMQVFGVTKLLQGARQRSQGSGLSQQRLAFVSYLTDVYNNRDYTTERRMSPDVPTFRDKQRLDVVLPYGSPTPAVVPQTAASEEPEPEAPQREPQKEPEAVPEDLPIPTPSRRKRRQAIGDIAKLAGGLAAGATGVAGPVGEREEAQ